MQKLLLFILFLFFINANAQVGIGTTNPQATLDINGDLAIRSVGDSNINKEVLTIGDNDIVTKRYCPLIYGISQLEIPICGNVSVGSSSTFSSIVNGVTYTITWTVLYKDIGSAGNLTNNQRAQKLQVRYDFSPALPFSPDGLALTGNNNNTGVFTLNYAAISATSLTINITRSDITSRDNSGGSCWTGQTYFNLLLLDF